MRWPNGTKCHTYKFLGIGYNSLLESISHDHIYDFAGKMILQVKTYHSSYLQPRNYGHHHATNQKNCTHRIVRIKHPIPVYDVYIKSNDF